MRDLTGFAAVLLDLDGVLTHTAKQHFQAWKSTFDDLLQRRHHGGTFEPFTQDDYHRYVDGMARRDGVRQFVASRGLALPEGTPEEPNSIARSTVLPPARTNWSISSSATKESRCIPTR